MNNNIILIYNKYINHNPLKGLILSEDLMLLAFSLLLSESSSLKDSIGVASMGSNFITGCWASNLWTGSGAVNFYGLVCSIG